MNDQLLQVGAPDPEATTSPIGAYVLSGSELLKCNGRGVRVKKGEQRSG